MIQTLRRLLLSEMMMIVDMSSSGVKGTSVVGSVTSSQGRPQTRLFIKLSRSSYLASVDMKLV